MIVRGSVVMTGPFVLCATLCAGSWHNREESVTLPLNYNQENLWSIYGVSSYIP
jgi:hypothetical protein